MIATECVRTHACVCTLSCFQMRVRGMRVHERRPVFVHIQACFWFPIAKNNATELRQQSIQRSYVLKPRRNTTTCFPDAYSK